MGAGGRACVGAWARTRAHVCFAVFFFRVLHTMFFDLCEGGSRIADLESGRARDVHASTVSPVCGVANVVHLWQLCTF